MSKIFTSKDNQYYIEVSGSNIFVMDNAEQCRLATTSILKAKNAMNSILSSAGSSEKVDFKALKNNYQNS